MQIARIFVSQRKLRAVDQLPAMLETLESGRFLPPINLLRDETGIIQVSDGHHRLSAIWLSGRSELLPNEYVLIESDWFRPRFGTVIDLLRRSGIEPRS